MLWFVNEAAFLFAAIDATTRAQSSYRPEGGGPIAEQKASAQELRRESEQKGTSDVL